MNEVKTEELFALGPFLFRNRNKGVMTFGFECGDGWYEPLKGLIIALEAELLSMPEDASSNIYATQVKEKFGLLRFYLSRHTDPTHVMIQSAAEECSRSCEECGAPGQLYASKTGYYYTSCPVHMSPDSSKLDQDEQ